MSGMSEEKLRARYRKLMEESFKLSRVNRRKGDEKLAEAEEVLAQINLIENNRKP